MRKATIFDMVRGSYVDGPGIRTTVFFKGCNLACAWCHNPESQRIAPELMLYKDKCRGCGKCREKCPHALSSCDLCGRCALYCPHDARELCGREYTTDEVLQTVRKDKSFYEASGGGVTLSGGECMLQLDFIEELLQKCKEDGIHTAVDTAGCVPAAAFDRILPYTDLFLFDVKCVDSEKHKRYTGVGNEQILANLRRLLAMGRPLWVRIPIVPTVNDTVGEMEAIRNLLAVCGKPERVELLPYHAMGEHKYAALGRESTPFSPPTDAQMEELRRVFLA